MKEWLSLVHIIPSMLTKQEVGWFFILLQSIESASSSAKKLHPELGSVSETSLVKTLNISEPQTFHVSSGVKSPFCILRVFKSETDLVQRGVSWHHYHLMDDHSPPRTYAHTLPSL